MIRVNTWTTRNSNGVTEHCEVSSTDSGMYGTGKYHWSNRPWQRYDFCVALSKAMKEAGFDEEAITMVQNKNSLNSAIEALQEVKR